ncbi:hypothetical protein ACI3EY_01695 [Ornithinimicrobium sp. LYQ92]|uniref:hypothetical protein n=1 Tax=Serinicoccus sp. LYQ92 TaxID=3378798 RepID=UPI003852B5D9
MHVVVVAHARHPLAEPFAGGLESLTAHLVSGLATRGHRVSVFAARVQDDAGRRECAALERTAHPRTVGSLALSGAEAEPGR